MKDQYIFDSLQGAVNTKQWIINNKDTYLRTVTIEVKHRHTTFFGAFWGHPDYTYEDKIVFDQEKYARDINIATHQIQYWQSVVEGAINECRRQIVINTIDEKALSESQTKIEQLRGDLAYYQQQNSMHYEEAREINHQIIHNLDKIGLLNEKIQIALSTENTLAQQVKQHQAEIYQREIKESELDKTNMILIKKISDSREAIAGIINEISPIKRSYLLANIYKDNNAKMAVDMLKACELDTEYLTYLSIEKNDSYLLDIALSRKANCTSCYINGKTIFQKAITENKDMVPKILANATEQDLDSVLLNSIKTNDDVTFKMLLHHNSNFIHKIFFGYTLLHIATSVNNAALVKYILEIDKSTINDSTNYGESAFKIALISNIEIAKLLSSYINVEKELMMLVAAREAVLLEHALKICAPQTSVLENLLIKALTTDDSMAKIITAYSPSIDIISIYNKALLEHDYNTLSVLAMTGNDNQFLDLLRQDEITWQEFQSYTIENTDSTFSLTDSYQYD